MYRKRFNFANQLYPKETKTKKKKEEETFLFISLSRTKYVSEKKSRDLERP